MDWIAIMKYYKEIRKAEENLAKRPAKEISENFCIKSGKRKGLVIEKSIKKYVQDSSDLYARQEGWNSAKIPCLGLCHVQFYFEGANSLVSFRLQGRYASLLMAGVLSYQRFVTQ
jgi:hypothetical protein